MFAVSATLRSNRATSPGVGRIIATAPTTAVEAGDSPVAALGPNFPPGVSLRPTADPGQAKMWFHDGRWWGVLLADGEMRMHTFDPAGGWADMGTLVDPRPFAQVDVAAAGDTVAVAAAGRGSGTRHAAEVRRFSYDGVRRAYVLAPGFPVRVTDKGVQDLTIARGGDGRLWSAFISDQQLLVARSAIDDSNWLDPAPITTEAAAVPIHAAATAAAGDQIVVLWGTVAGSYHVATTTDGESWRASRLMVGAAPGEPGSLSFRALPTTPPTFAGLIDLGRRSGGLDNLLAPHVVAVTGGGDQWAIYEVTKVGDRFGSPTLVVNEAAGSVMVLGVVDGAVRWKEAALSRPVFPTGPGRVIVPAELGGVFDHPTAARVTRAGEGIVVLAADSEHGRYGYASEGVPPVQTAAGQHRSGALVGDTFDGRPADAPPPRGWALASASGPGSVTLAPGIKDNGLLLRTSGPEASARACRSFAPTSRRLTVSNVVKLTGSGDGDAVLLSVRGRGELGSLRVDGRGRPAWFDGATKNTATRAVLPGTWYQARVDVDFASQTYSVELREVGGTVIARETNLQWRDPEGGEADAVCSETRRGTTAELVVDDVMAVI